MSFVRQRKLVKKLRKVSKKVRKLKKEPFENAIPIRGKSDIDISIVKGDKLRFIVKGCYALEDGDEVVIYCTDLPFHAKVLVAKVSHVELGNVTPGDRLHLGYVSESDFVNTISSAHHGMGPESMVTVVRGIAL